MLFGAGLFNKIFDLKVAMLSEMFLSSFFHSDIAAGKKEFLKRLWLILNCGMLLQFLV